MDEWTRVEVNENDNGRTRIWMEGTTDADPREVRDNLPNHHSIDRILQIQDFIPSVDFNLI